MSFLHDICERHITKGNVFAVFGDLNCNVLNKGNSVSDLCNVFALKNIVNGPTCFKGESASLVDVFLTNRPKCFSGTFNTDLGISDFHNCIGVASKMHAPLKMKRKITYRRMKDFEESAFLHDVNCIPFQVCDIFDDIDDYFWAYEKMFIDVVNDHAPLKSRYIHENQSPFMNSELRKAINQRNMWRGKHFRDKGNRKLRENYTKWRNKVVKIRNKSISRYFDIKCNGKTGSRDFYKTLRPFISNKNASRSANKIVLSENESVITDSSRIAEIFDTYYASLAEYPGVSDGLDYLNFNQAIEKHTSHTSIMNINANIKIGNRFFFKNVYPEDISKYISKLHTKKSVGHDGLSAAFLKLSANDICSSLSTIFNKCISKSSFPHSMKLADISPIFKKRDNLCKENYRSISILTSISKVFERILCDQLLVFFDNIFSVSISAYRKGYNCQHVLLQITEYWRRSLDDDNFVGTLSMDLSKAFDCMPHALLISKLYAYGVSVDSCHLLISYLKDRHQRIKIQDNFSTWSTINRGVPQGSVLGPILFNIFVNDLYYVNLSSDIANYADDNSLYHSSHSIDDLIDTLKTDTCTTVSWFADNHMMANTEKFQCTIMDRKGHIPATITIHDSAIHSEEHITVLGVKLDAKLKFDSHITDIVKRASKQINVLKRISKFLDAKSRINIYTTFISANFNYCPISWMFCGKKNSKLLEKLQERVLRFVFNDHNSPYEILLQKGGFLSLAAYRLYFLGVEVYKCKCKCNPPYINQLLDSRKFKYELRDCDKFKQPKFNTVKYGFRSFSYYGAKLWNELPVHVKKSKTLTIFKKNMKDWCHTDQGKKSVIC